MGQVYLAIDTRLKRQVAIKILSPTLAVDLDRLARCQREAEVLALLNHPNIGRIQTVPERRRDACSVLGRGPSKSGAPTQLFETSSCVLGAPGQRSYDVAPDGKRFVMLKNTDAPGLRTTPPRIVVVQNWFEELKRLVPTK